VLLAAVRGSSLSQRAAVNIVGGLEEDMGARSVHHVAVAGGLDEVVKETEYRLRAKPFLSLPVLRLQLIRHLGATNVQL